MYSQSIEKSKLKRMTGNFKSCVSSAQDKPRFKNRAQTQEESRSAKVILERGGASQNEKLTSVTC